MAMYLFASRLSAAVCSRKSTAAEPRTKCSVHATGQSPPKHRVESTQHPDIFIVSSAPEVGASDDSSTALTSALRRRGAGTERRPTAKHRVRFANTFPRVNRKKRLSELHEEGEVLIQDHVENIEEAIDSKQHKLVYRDGCLVSGPLEALVRLMAPTGAGYRPDRAYLFAFLLGSRIFLRPAHLLGQLAFLCGRSNDKTVLRNLVQLLSEWMETFPYDFRDDRVMAHVRSILQRSAENDKSDNQINRRFSAVNHVSENHSAENHSSENDKIKDSSSPKPRKWDNHSAESCGSRNHCAEKCQCENNSVENYTSENHSAETDTISDETCDSGQVSNTLQALLDRLTALEEYEKFLANIETDKVKGKLKGSILDVCSEPKVLARQLTLVEFERMSFVGPEEFVYVFGEDGAQFTAKNLQAYLSWTNRLTYMVATEIVKQEKRKQRIRTLDLWLRTAKQCADCANYNSTAAILAGLNLPATSRLAATWSKSDRELLSSLNDLMGSAEDFVSYRTAFKTETRRVSTSKEEGFKIVIPFSSLVLRDASSLRQACSEKLANGHVNFEKFWQLAKLVMEFVSCQQEKCGLSKDPQISIYLQSCQLYGNTELNRASFQCEKPANAEEKVIWKTLQK